MAAPTLDGHASATGSGASASVALTTTNVDDIIVLCSFGQNGNNGGGAGFPGSISSISTRPPTPTVAESNSGNWSTGVSTFSWSHTVAGPNTIIFAAIYIYNAAARTVSSMTCGGVAMTKLDSITSTLEGNTQDMEVWYLKAPSAGANTIAVTLSGSASFVQGQSILVQDIDQTSPIDSHTIGQSTSSVGTFTQNTTVVGSEAFQVGFFWGRVTPTISAGTGTTLLQATGNSQGSGCGTANVGSGTHGLTFNMSASGAVPGAATISLKPAITALTWTQRSITSQGVTGTYPWALEVWWAHSPVALSSRTITANYSKNTDRVTLVAFGVSGCYLTAPWDPNASLPKTVQARGTLSGVITTTNVNDFLIAVMGSEQQSSSFGQTSVPTGFTLVDSAADATSFGAEIGVGYKGVTATQSSVTVTWGASMTPSNSANNAGFIIDALTADAPAVAGSGQSAVSVIS